jgi:hypothetical protein
MDAIGESCSVQDGSVKVNSMEFLSSGTRIHVRDFPVQVTAVTSEGYVFSHWLEFPDSAATFMLLQTDTGDIHLTPVFVEEVDLCYLQSQLLFTEVMPWDSVGPDRLEIYNPTTDPINLSGAFLSDRMNNLKHSFGSITIEPFGYLVIEFKDSLQGEYLVDEFAFDKAGETIYLFLPDSTLVDSMKWEQVLINVSYGYCPDDIVVPSLLLAAGIVQLLDSVTFGFPNVCLVEDTTSITEQDVLEFSIWPNPTVNILNLQTVVDEFVIYNTWGQRVQEGSMANQVEVTNLTSGMYILEITIENTKKQVKFLKE